ncbi:MAG: bifunctional folylpolyglutamate synthase/dihydrofolate synthase [Verrucomicrobia bacterium]|nr:bifunctional folylpolyglutamate synthase/dihydrofolate synthase [Verrucomicrobiota bacterium]
MSSAYPVSPAEYAAVCERLYALKARGVSFGIDRMRAFTRLLGQPERAVPLIHVAGTNGKGSVSAMLASILRAAGRRTGLYTSPHLVRLGERVQVDGVALSEPEIVAYYGELAPVVAGLERGAPGEAPSFFELMTAMAFLQFARRACDVAIIEVGLGGRLDATNIILPEVSVITSIGLDHCELLGDTLEKIAAEKAGIIKPGVPVVMGRLPLEAEAVVRAIAAERGAPLTSVREVFGEDIAAYPQAGLEGDYQRLNAATATLVARLLAGRFGLTESHLQAGLTNVSWPGRWQRTRLADGRLLVLDASHNPEGAAVLDDLLGKLVTETGRRPVVITGVLGVSRAAPLLAVVGRHAREIHLARPQQARASTFEELEALVPAEFFSRAATGGGQIHRATVEGLFPGPGVCAAGGPGDVLVVTGSIYLLGEVVARLEPDRGAGEQRLQDF